MKKEKISLRILVCLMLGMACFSSCKKDKDDPALVAAVDVYGKKITGTTESRTALIFVAQGNKDLNSVKVKAPGKSGKSYTLTANKATKRIFQYTPIASDYKKTKPVAGKYVFTVESTEKGESKITMTDALAADTLAAMVISKTEFASSKLKTTWKKVKNANNYVLRLKDKKGNIIFYQKGIKSSIDSYSFGTSTKGWQSKTKAVKGTKYTLEVIAVLYEKGAKAQSQAANVQFISVGQKEITWGK